MTLVDILICVWFVLSTMGKVLLAGLLLCVTVGFCADAWDYVTERLATGKERRR